VSAARGAARERKVADELRADGWIVKGTGDAHGAIDQIACRHGVTRIIQVKGSRRSPYSDFPPHERAQFLREARQAGWGLGGDPPCEPPVHIEAWLAWAPPDRKPTRWIHPDEWPELPYELLAESFPGAIS
jgi:hypothetical protein